MTSQPGNHSQTAPQLPDASPNSCYFFSSPVAVTPAFPLRMPPPYAQTAHSQSPTPQQTLLPPPAAPAHPSGVVPHVLQLPARSSSRVPASQRRTPSTPADKLCNCRNSKCLKLYCECFASGRYCAGCNCLNCLNNKENETQRSKAIETILERNPNAFRPKIQFQQGDDGCVASTITRHTKGCSCRKSNCLKKYCECFQAGIFCAATCRCKECKNYEGSEHLMAVMDTSDPVQTAPMAVSRSPVAPAILQHTAAPITMACPAESNKRQRIPARPSAHNAGGGIHYLPTKQEPAREAIKTSRDKKVQEVVAQMLVKLHMEGYTLERKRKASQMADSAEEPAPAETPTSNLLLPGSRDWALKQQANLSDYYVTTEGVLLNEFGNFLGKMCDRIDQQVQKHRE